MSWNFKSIWAFRSNEKGITAGQETKKLFRSAVLKRSIFKNGLLPVTLEASLPVLVSQRSICSAQVAFATANHPHPLPKCQVEWSREDPGAQIQPLVWLQRMFLLNIYIFQNDHCYFKLSLGKKRYYYLCTIGPLGTLRLGRKIQVRASTYVRLQASVAKCESSQSPKCKCGDIRA